MKREKSFYRLYFQYYFIPNNEISPVSSVYRVVIQDNRDRFFFLKHDIIFDKIIRKSMLIGAFQKPRPEFFMNLQSAINNFTGEGV